VGHTSNFFPFPHECMSTMRVEKLPQSRCDKELKETTNSGASSTVEVQVGHKGVNATAGQSARRRHI
jgi:hypothetical protein